MNSSALLMRAARGPVMLIALGVMFALDHAGVVSFWKTWPVQIILLGLMKLFEMMLGGTPAPGVPHYPYGYPAQPGAPPQPPLDVDRPEVPR